MTEIEFFDYIKCPVFYDAVHRKKLPFMFQPTMAELLSKVSNKFFLNLMNGKVLAASTLKTTWDKICEENKFITSTKCLEGIDKITKMFRWASNIELRILDVNVPYMIPIKNGDFSGEISTIAVNSKGNPELLVMDFSNKHSDQSMLDMKLKYALDALAFKQNYGQEIGTHIHNAKYDEEYYVYSTRDDFIRAKTALDSVSKAIEEQIFYPRENAFCASCEMKVFCRQWHV